MKKPSRFLRVVATIGMLLGLMVVAAPVATAQAPASPGINPGASKLFPGSGIAGAQEVYFPWVGNADSFGLGEADSAITLQNLTGASGYVYIYYGTGSGWTFATSAFLDTGASKTFTADLLGVPSPGAPVIAGLYRTASLATSGQVCEWEIGQDINGDGDLNDCFDYPATETRYIPLFLGGTVKSAVGGANLPYTSATDTSVSGYNGLSGMEVGEFDELFLPIVQYTCDGPGGCWDTRITVSNFRTDLNAGVEARFFPGSDGEGSLQTGFQLQTLLGPGGTWQIDLSDWVDADWVGSVHIYTDDYVGAIADRYKTGTGMWLTNLASNKSAELDLQPDLSGLFGSANYALFAPAVYLDYNGWNTGVSVANLVNFDNEINIQYYVNAGNAPVGLTQRLAPHGMTFFYNPSDPPEDGTGQNPQMDRLAAMLILSDEPVAAAVDAVKYFGNDGNVGQAMSYSASGNIWGSQAMPLVQKGSPSTGMGATSGIHLFNPLPLQNVIRVDWLNQSGFNAANFASTTVIVPAEALGFAYTMNHHNIPNGYYGAAYAESTLLGLNGLLPFGMTSANVDYQVQGDGSVIWNGYNPCGLFRQVDLTGATNFCEIFEPATITTTLTMNQAPIAGVTVALFDDPNCFGTALGTRVTDATGEAVFTVNDNSFDEYCVEVQDDLGQYITDFWYVYPDSDLTTDLAGLAGDLTVNAAFTCIAVGGCSATMTWDMDLHATTADNGTECIGTELVSVDDLGENDTRSWFLANTGYCVDGAGPDGGAGTPGSDWEAVPTVPAAVTMVLVET